MEIALLASMIALGYTLVNLVKQARDQAWDPVLTQIATWAAGVAVVFLGSATTWAAKIDIQGVLLNDLNAAEKVFLGACLLSVASVGYDFKKALDGSDSAHVPSLLPPPSPAE